VTKLGAILSSQDVTGTYTPTLTNVTNLDATTAYQCQYLRLGDIVIVSGRLDADPTAAASTEVGISLPVASNIGAGPDLAGVAFCDAVAGLGARLLGDITNDRARMIWVATDTANRAFSFIFLYRII